MAVHLTKGSRLRGYTLTTNMSASDAGTSMWAFAEQDGFDYFVKCYLSPVFPDPEGPGSERSKARRRARCEAFEVRMKRVEATLQQCGDGNFMVRGTDFFREDGTYFKITKKIYSIRPRVFELPAHKQLLILLSAAFSLKSLHERSSFIHADIKPENFMIQRAGAGLIANLIDFDAGFYTGQPPVAEEMIGDQRYWAPELISWLAQEARPKCARPTVLLQSLDVFSLGLTFCEYLCGTLPFHTDGYAYPGEALLGDAVLEMPVTFQSGLEPVIALIREMLHKDPLSRPSASRVHEQLRAFNREHFVTDNTYLKIAESLKQGLLQGGKSLANLATSRGKKRVYQSASDLL
ncbi:MAG: protein kinase domain-containing protein, partial [Gammaproteobacteria bacterium]